MHDKANRNFIENLQMERSSMIFTSRKIAEKIANAACKKGLIDGYLIAENQEARYRLYLLKLRNKLFGLTSDS